MQKFSTHFRQAFIGAALIFGCVFEVAAATPNDPRFSAEWHLKKINAPAAWNVTTGSKETVVVVLDTGVNYNNPDLAPNMWRNPGETGLDANGKDKATNGIDDDNDGYIDDVYGVDTWNHTGDPMDHGFTRGTLTVPYTHGTSCAGVIGAVGNNGKDTVGVNWAVSIMALRVFPVDFDHNWNNPKVTRAFVDAFAYVLEMKRRGVNIVVVSASAGLPSYHQALKDVVDACGAAGILTVAAAGNNGLNNDQIGGYLSAFNFQHLIVVGASLQDDTLWNYSNYGRSTVHLAAPGMNIVTTDRDDFCCTSSATPQVSGAIALLKSALPDATADELKAAILGSVDQPSTLNGKLVTGGRLNVGKALARLTNDTAPTIVVTALPVSPRTRAVDPIQVTFSRAMDRASLEAALSFNPPISGRFEWENDDRTVTLVPDQALLWTNYTAIISRTARDARGDTLDGNYNGVRQDSPADDFKWTFGFGVPNDDFRSAITINGAAGSHKGTTRNASPEVEEPDHAQSRLSSPSVWYRWTAPADGWETFDALQSTAYDTILAVYKGDSLSTLREVSANDNYGTRIQSRMSFEAVAGTTYFIAVASKSSEANKLVFDESTMGPFTLNCYPTPPPGFTGVQFSPAIAGPGAKVTLTGTNFTGATSVLFNGVSATFSNAVTNNTDLRITAMVPLEATSGPITVVTPQGSITSTELFLMPPRLSITRIEGRTLVDWPAVNTGFTLEESLTMEPGSWKPVSQTPLSDQDGYSLSIPATEASRFYRLRK